MKNRSWLAKASVRASEHSSTMGHALNLYQRIEDIDEDLLAQELGCDRQTVQALYLCLRPRLEHFASDIESICDRLHLDSARLTVLLRKVKAVETVRNAWSLVKSEGKPKNMAMTPEVEAAIQHFEKILVQEIRRGRTLEEAASASRAFAAPDFHRAIDIAAQRIKEQRGRIGNLREPRSFRSETAEPWYTGPSEGDVIWPAYLARISKRLPKTAVDSLDRSTSKILSLLSPPGMGKIRTRGLVLGYVQSGKTANYIGLNSKAADVGYRFFIVLSGVIEALRVQTQERIQADLINLNPDRWVTLTSAQEDFRTHTNVNVFLAEHANVFCVAVIKKNQAILRRLISWLQGAQPQVLVNCPAVIIDDEADQAGINTAAGDERTVINGLIMDLLELLPKAAYVGYTATPYANLLIDPSVPEGLYPRDFIVDLPHPDGYFGPEKIFGRDPMSLDEPGPAPEGIDVIRLVPEEEVQYLKPLNRAAATSFQPQVTPTLRTACLYFWLATAARRCRSKQDDHSSMLVHTTINVTAHNLMRPLIQGLQQSVETGITSNSSAMIEKFRAIWESEMGRVPPSGPDEPPVSFAEIQPLLLDVIRGTKVLVENSYSLERVDYSQPGQIVIVIGGNVLSRGLTLEGLVVSYFVRSASTYDTLLQAGRWFGYRPGYSDLPRIWMTSELVSHFYDLATIEQEIRYDVERFETEHLTPLQFAVRLRTHPVLNITAPGKMRSAVDVRRSYGGRRFQTILFHHRDEDWLTLNLLAARRLLQQSVADGAIPRDLAIGTGKLLENVDCHRVLEFLNSYRFHENSRELRGDLVQGYIREQVEKYGNLRTWNLVVMGRDRTGSHLGEIDLNVGEPVGLINRAPLRLPDEFADIKALMSHSDAVADIPDLHKRANKHSISELMEIRTKTLPKIACAVIYPISRRSEPRNQQDVKVRRPMNAVEEVIGLGLIFPDAGEHDTPQTYVAAPLPPEEDTELLDAIQEE